MTELVGLRLLIQWLDEDSVLASSVKSAHRTKVWNKISEIETALEGEITGAVVSQFDGSAEVLTDEFYQLLDQYVSPMLGVWKSSEGAKVYYGRTSDDLDSVHYDYAYDAELSYNDYFGEYQMNYSTGTSYSLDKCGDYCMQYLDESLVWNRKSTVTMNPSEPTLLTFAQKRDTH